jgi:hypothetical protein
MKIVLEKKELNIIVEHIVEDYLDSNKSYPEINDIPFEVGFDIEALYEQEEDTGGHKCVYASARLLYIKHEYLNDLEIEYDSEYVESEIEKMLR